MFTRRGRSAVKIVLIGASGTIGRAVARAFEDRGHEVLRVGRSDGEATVDLGAPESIRSLYQAIGSVDAVVCTAGVSAFGAVDDVDDAGWDLSIRNKMMGQINLVRFGVDAVRDGGSFVLTTGTLSARPTPGSAAVAAVGGAVESFVKAAALDRAGRHRVNAVSPGWVAESRVASGLDPMPGIWAKDLAAYYVRLVEGFESGVVLDAEAPLD